MKGARDDCIPRVLEIDDLLAPPQIGASRIHGIRNGRGVVVWSIYVRPLK
jgi:hypothetical protein